MNENNIKPGQKSEYWRSIGEYENGRAELEPFMPEFPKQVAEEFDPNKLSQLSRRKFFALLGASSAFAMASCNNYRDKGEIVTYNNKPEFSTMGEAVYYASSLSDGSGVLIKTREGRPVKIDGNPEHPINKGKLSQQGHASILNLYSPERIKNPLRKRDSNLILHKNEMLNAEWSKVDKEIIEKLNKAVSEDKEIVVISHSVLSPSQSSLLSNFVLKYPTTKIYTYELHSDINRVEAWDACYNYQKATEDKGKLFDYEIEPVSSLLPAVKWDKAKIILALESDFLGSEGNFTENIRLYSQTRDFKNPKEFSRLYSVEAAMSITGMNSDYRMRLKPELQTEFVLCLAAEIAKETGAALDPAASAVVSGHSLTRFVEQNKLNKKYIGFLLKDLLANRGKSIVHAGEKLPVDTHIAVNLLNELLGATELYNFNSQYVYQWKLSAANDIKSLADNMNAGKVGIIINFDTNPVYHFPDDTGYKQALAKVPTVISLTMNTNESTANNTYILPINHDLESWGDYHVRSGIYGLQQPVIAPLYSTRQKEAILLNWLSDKPESYQEDIYHKYIMSHWESMIYLKSNPAFDFRKFWLGCLHDGFTTIPTNSVKPAFKMPELKSGKSTAGMTVILTRNYTIGDGRYSDNGWLQEIPHPITKATWDNYASISPATAAELGLKNNDVIEIKIKNRSVKLPVMLQPGMADATVAIELGFGRTEAGAAGSNVGQNANVLLSKDGDFSQWIYSGASITKTGETYKVFSTQEHHPVDEDFVKDFHFKRDIVRMGTVEEYIKNPEFLKGHEHEIISMTPHKEYTGVKWAMAIDMNRCVACTNCVIACNVENNVPVVGKDQVAVGREMHWIRIDRYYSGTPEEPVFSSQPMLCQQCDNAPCENVCPVQATSHTEDGLNAMVYNRCVGTRYCGNNCPYKVRRFNYFNYRDHFANGFFQLDSITLMNNPEVTVRSRGVMEKCTFCIQRISEAKQEATKHNRPLKGSDVKTACQIACPSDAIIFGDMNDPESDVSQYRKHNLGYHVLELLNIIPNITYIAKLRNKHTEDNSAHGLHS